MGSDAHQPQKRLGAWVAGLSAATSYQAATDGFVLAYNDTAGADLTAETDSANPPTTVRTRHFAEGTGSRPGVTMAVRKSHYWEVTTSGGTAVIFWIPLEP